MEPVNIFYAITVALAVGVIAWAGVEMEEDSSLSFEIGMPFIAACGFCVFPFLNVITSIILAVMVADFKEKKKARKAGKI